MISQQLPERLDAWLVQMENCGVKKLQNFAWGLRQDYDAMKAALVYDWSNGQVEGQVNRLKTIKHQMYGRATFDLLRQRVLGPPWHISYKVRENRKVGAGQIVISGFFYVFC